MTFQSVAVIHGIVTVVDGCDWLRSRGHDIYAIGDNHVQGGFASFASPVAILRDPDADFSAGVDTFHSAHALGL